jgi:hypothetical protein
MTAPWGEQRLMVRRFAAAVNAADRRRHGPMAEDRITVTVIARCSERAELM